VRESIRMHRDIGAASGEALACQRLGALLTARGDWENGRVILEDGIMAAEHATLRAHCLVRLYAALARNRLEARDLDAADHALILGLEMSQRHGHCASCDALLLPAAISVRIKQGNLPAAEIFCNQLDEASEKYASRIWVAMARQARAELAAAQNKLDQAVMGYHEAYENFTIAGNAYKAARCLSASSEIRLQRRAPRDDVMAQEAQAEAREIYARLGVG